MRFNWMRHELDHENLQPDVHGGWEAMSGGMGPSVASAHGERAHMKCAPAWLCGQSSGKREGDAGGIRIVVGELVAYDT